MSVFHNISHINKKSLNILIIFRKTNMRPIDFSDATLATKDDFAAAQVAWDQFWAGTLPRPIISAVLPRPGVEPVPPPPWGAAYSRSAESVVDQALRFVETHQFLADAVPCHTPSLCIGMFGAMLGGQMEEVRESWGVDTRCVPFLERLDEPEKLQLDRHGPWWEKYFTLLETYQRKASGAFVFAEPTSIYNLDFYAEIRGVSQAMLDFYDDPEGVHRIMARLLEIHTEFFAAQKTYFAQERWGSVTRHGFYSRGWTAVPQCDFGYSIGPEQFQEFALPYLQQECALLDDVEYHLDGVGNLRHLDAICNIPNVKVIQWVPGSGPATKQDWTPLYKKIADKGIGLYLGVLAEQVQEFRKRYQNAPRMMLSVKAENAAQVQKLMDELEK